MKRRDVAWILIFIVDVAYIVWGAMAAASPDHLLGPGGKAILPAGYEGYSNGSWSQLVGTSPLTAGYTIVLFRMYGIYCVLFGLMASAIAVTAFRRGDGWAWWALLVGNTIAFVSAMMYDRSSRSHRSFPPSGTARSIDWLIGRVFDGRNQWNRFTWPI